MLFINNLGAELKQFFQRHGRAAPGSAWVADQAGALPYRLTGQGCEVLLVTSKRTGRWVLPKGWPAAGESLVQSAAREAYEEAGVIGMVEPIELGRLVTSKVRMGGSTDHVVVVYPLRVELQLADWPERSLRRRQWWRLAEARLIMAVPQRDMLGALERSIDLAPDETGLNDARKFRRLLRARSQ